MGHNSESEEKTHCTENKLKRKAKDGRKGTLKKKRDYVAIESSSEE